MLPTLGLEQLGKELDAYDPPTAEGREAMGENRVCPTVAWKVGGTVVTIQLELTDIVQKLVHAGGQTEASVREEWSATQITECLQPELSNRRRR